ncbi:hypothetical protein PF003_g38979 [Phytophthora fragariae]|nr:hypothetical protein PF003_g38979 [Phytophthora fragariae]
MTRDFVSKTTCHQHLVAASGDQCFPASESKSLSPFAATGAIHLVVSGSAVSRAGERGAASWLGRMMLCRQMHAYRYLLDELLRCALRRTRLQTGG